MNKLLKEIIKSKRQIRFVIKSIKQLIKFLKSYEYKQESGIKYALYIFNKRFKLKHFDVECFIESSFKESFLSWEHYSGNSEFPVTIKGCDPELLFVRTKDFWNHEEEYGMLRILLLNHVLDHFNKQISILENNLYGENNAKYDFWKRIKKAASKILG